MSRYYYFLLFIGEEQTNVAAALMSSNQKKKKRYFCCIGISQSSHTEPANGNVCTHSTFSGPLVSSLEVTANQNGSEPSQLYKEGCLPKLTSSYLSCRRGSNFLQVTLDNMRDVSEARLFPLVC